MDELISVIIPVYNVQAYLVRCVDSVINQSYDNLEIILVDDGSLDNSSQICDELALKDRRIKVIHKTNRGLSDARNVGLEKSVGDYILFIDSDDFIHQKMVEKMYGIIQKNETDIVVCGIFRTDGEVHKAIDFGYLNDVPVVSSQVALQDILSYKCTIAAWNKLYKRSCIGDTRFIVGRYNEDLPFLFELFNKNLRISYITEPLYYYFFNPNGITGKFSGKLLDGLKNAIEIHANAQKRNLSCVDYTLEYLDKNVIGAIRMLLLNHARMKFSSHWMYCKQYSVKNWKRILFSSHYTYKMKLWILFSLVLS